MQDRIRNHIRSNVVGYVALFFALSLGTAYATHPGGANTISSGDIINGEVKNPDIGGNAVGSGQINDGAVRSPDIRDGAVQSADIDTNAVTNPKLASRSVGFLELQFDSVHTSNVMDDTLRGRDVNDGSLTGDDIDDDSLTGDDIDENAVPGLEDPRGYARVTPRRGEVRGASVGAARNVEQSHLVKPDFAPDGDPLVGYYCFYLPFAVRHIQVTPESNNRVGWDVTGSISDSSACQGEESAHVETFTGSGEPVDASFFVAFFD